MSASWACGGPVGTRTPKYRVFILSLFSPPLLFLSHTSLHLKSDHLMQTAVVYSKENPTVKSFKVQAANRKNQTPNPCFLLFHHTFLSFYHSPWQCVFHFILIQRLRAFDGLGVNNRNYTAKRRKSVGNILELPEIRLRVVGGSSVPSISSVRSSVDPLQWRKWVKGIRKNLVWQHAEIEQNNNNKLQTCSFPLMNSLCS